MNSHFESVTEPRRQGAGPRCQAAADRQVAQSCSAKTRPPDLVQRKRARIGRRLDRPSEAVLQQQHEVTDRCRDVLRTSVMQVPSHTQAARLGAGPAGRSAFRSLGASQTTTLGSAARRAPPNARSAATRAPAGEVSGWQGACRCENPGHRTSPAATLQRQRRCVRSSRPWSGAHYLRMRSPWTQRRAGPGAFEQSQEP